MVRVGFSAQYYVKDSKSSEEKLRELCERYPRSIGYTIEGSHFVRVSVNPQVDDGLPMDKQEEEILRIDRELLDYLYHGIFGELISFSHQMGDPVERNYHIYINMIRELAEDVNTNFKEIMDIIDYAGRNLEDYRYDLVSIFLAVMDEMEEISDLDHLLGLYWVREKTVLLTAISDRIEEIRSGDATASLERRLLKYDARTDKNQGTLDEFFE